MATWNITPSDASINSSGVASFPSNTGNVAKIYTVTYTDDAGCGGSTTYTVPACPPPPPTPVDCGSYGFVDQSPTEPATGNIGVSIATSLKSKSQLNYRINDSWISYQSTGGDSTRYSYIFAASSNAGGSYREGSVTFTSSDGCEFTAHMYQNGKTCQCSDIESSIVYENTYLPTSSKKNLILFSADTQGCGSISAFCSSTGDDIFEEQSGNLVKVVRTNNVYAVYANVLSMPSSVGNLRSCVVNIYVYKSDGSLCKTIAKEFRQDREINCSNLLSRNGTSFCGSAFNGTTTGEVEMVRSCYSDSLTRHAVFILEGTSPSWLSSPSTFRYKLEDDRWKVYATIYSQNTGVDDRQVSFTQFGYIFDNEIQPNPDRYYTADELKRMSGTKCGEYRSTVGISHLGCNCKHAWTSRIHDKSSTYSAQTVEIDLSPYHNDCATITGHAKKDTCDWVSFLTLADNRYLRYNLSENTSYTSGRKCIVELYLTDAGGNTCTVEFEIYQYSRPLDCSNCESVIANTFNKTYDRIGSDGRKACPISYNASLTASSECNGHISYTFDSTGIDNPIVGIRHVEDVKSYGWINSYFAADPNTTYTRRKMNVTIHYSGPSLSNCTTTAVIEQEAGSRPPGTGCTSSSYDYAFSYISSGKGSNINNPIILHVGDSSTLIGTLANTIPSEFADCAFIEVKTAQDVAIPGLEVSPKTGGGYNIYATPSPSPLSEDEKATVVVQWYYYNSNGSKVYPSGDNNTIYVEVVN